MLRAKSMSNDLPLRSSTQATYTFEPSAATTGSKLAPVPVSKRRSVADQVAPESVERTVKTLSGPLRLSRQTTCTSVPAAAILGVAATKLGTATSSPWSSRTGAPKVAPESVERSKKMCRLRLLVKPS